MRRVLARITDLETGEILYCDSKKMPDDMTVIKKHFEPVFESFFRGCNQNRDLQIYFSVKEFHYELPINYEQTITDTG